MRRFLFVFLWGCLAYSPNVRAQENSPENSPVDSAQLPPLPSQEALEEEAIPKGALEITASGGIEWVKGKNFYLAFGGVEVKHQDTLMRSERLVAYYQKIKGKNQVTRIDAEQKVSITLPQGVAYGDIASYDQKQELYLIRGDRPRLETAKGSESISARDSLEYWEKRKLFIGRGDVLYTQDKIKLQADLFVAKIDPREKDSSNRTFSWEYRGNVRFRGEDVYIRAKEAFYDSESEVLIFQGDVEITQKKTQIRGEKAQWDIQKKKGSLYSEDGSKVRALITR